ncbi:hypothetical protein KIN20_029029 [Parelaphostrongylus tenuis]|uniref:Uncharacterized protein n=1 Tax=Parelaphostrongylus tenuis TaxID=148309 RepID=A0AAD5WF68_PARTN|nr:hypothetical protein KIN20_029029 [Parelaphostrongylus tenuis]
MTGWISGNSRAGEQLHVTVTMKMMTNLHINSPIHRIRNDDCDLRGLHPIDKRHCH